MCTTGMPTLYHQVDEFSVCMDISNLFAYVWWIIIKPNLNSQFCYMKKFREGNFTQTDFQFNLMIDSRTNNKYIKALQEVGKLDNVWQSGLIRAMELILLLVRDDGVTAKRRVLSTVRMFYGTNFPRSWTCQSLYRYELNQLPMAEDMYSLDFCCLYGQTTYLVRATTKCFASNVISVALIFLLCFCGYSP